MISNWEMFWVFVAVFAVLCNLRPARRRCCCRKGWRR